MKNILILIPTFALGALCGFFLKPTQAPCPPPKKPIPCPICPKPEPCDFNITGYIKNESSGLLGMNIKKRVVIYFNGIEVMNGYMNPTNNADLIGLYKGQDTTAKCSGAEPIMCNITYKNNTHLLKFEGK